MASSLDPGVELAKCRNRVKQLERELEQELKEAQLRIDELEAALKYYAYEGKVK